MYALSPLEGTVIWGESRSVGSEPRLSDKQIRAFVKKIGFEQKQTDDIKIVVVAFFHWARLTN
jgi:hypothetical protein